MPASIPVTAVFDIGKTNKKFLLFNRSFEVMEKEYITFKEKTDDDGFPSEDLQSLTEWMDQQLNRVLEAGRYRIMALNFSTYGATLVHLGEHGDPVTPLYNYLKPYPEKLLKTLYRQFGGREKFVLETASPPMGMLNSGLQLYWLKHKKPEVFQKIRISLHFPQYLSYRYTGSAMSELTSIGCHTGLWNFRKFGYHEWVEKEGLSELFPEIVSAGNTTRGFFGESEFETGPGIHDSSAALVPYLYGLEVPFMLLSTGTWNIAMNPFNGEPLSFDELRKDCLSFINIYGEPVKAARFFLGNEYAHQKKKAGEHFNRDEEIQLDPALLKKLIRENDPAKKLKLETAHTSGPYPAKDPQNPASWDLSVFSSYEEACHQLMLDLVSIQVDSIRLAQGSGRIDKMIVTGGFSQNLAFMSMLASCFPAIDIYTDSLSHASALGAAMVMQKRTSKAGEKVEEIMDLTRHEPLENTGIETYKWK
ncbi:MAG: FGGY family carbohydrate kinase [Balneolaceae bacterium]